MQNPEAPLVSVIIPTYNHAQFLQAAIQSVIGQTFTDWEVVVVNNYSEDNTIEVVASFDDPRIRLVNFRNNGIIAASRNYGIDLAKGRYIAFLDSDDVWYPDKLRFCVEAISGQADAVCHGEIWVKEGAAPHEVYYGPRERLSYLSLLYDGNCLSTSAMVVRKSAINKVGGFSENPTFVTAEDYELWLRLAKAGCVFTLIKKILGEYRIHGGNQSKVALRNYYAEVAVIEAHLASIGKEEGRRLRARRRFSLAYYGAARAMQADGNHGAAAKLLLQSWWRYPFILRQYGAAGIGLVRWLKQRFHG
jgi:glycosyltransferase involved in cell wall biosynthesis